MKTILVIVLAAGTAFAADTIPGAKAPPSPTPVVAPAPSPVVAVTPQNFHAGEIQGEVFGVLAIPNITGTAQWGAGVGVGYFVTRGLGLSVRGMSYNDTGAAVDFGETRLIFRAPLWDRIAPYGFVSGDHNFDNGNWGAGAGGGLEFRPFDKKLSGVGFFAETGIDIDASNADHAGTWRTVFGTRYSF